MAKLIILCGISGSGKSTFSATTIQHNPERYVRISRDKIREMLYSYNEDNVDEYYYRNDLYKLEEQVTDIEDLLIATFLGNGNDVIVDATHLKAKYLNRFDKFPATKEIIFLNVTLKEALTRNKWRTRKVDDDIIIKQYENYLNLRKFLTDNKLKFDYICTEINN